MRRRFTGIFTGHFFHPVANTLQHNLLTRYPGRGIRLYLYHAAERARGTPPTNQPLCISLPRNNIVASSAGDTELTGGGRGVPSHLAKFQKAW